MKVGSLFAGVGGFDIAAERAGMDIAWQSEIDKHASAVLEHRWPGLNLGDIHEISEPPAVDVLTGGFPCQDYSVAGKRGGLAGDRGAVWWEYLRLIAEGRPRWVVGENVPGLLSSNSGRDFRTIIGSLVELGYGVVWRILDAQYFGVAQRRRRVFIVGHSGGTPRPEVLALAEGMSGYPEPRRKERQAVAGEPVSSSGGPITGTIGTTFGAKNYSNHQEVMSGSLVVAFHENQRGELFESPTTGALGAGGGKPGQGYKAIRQGTQVRRLTPLECERLQGFPDNWTATPGNSDTQRYRQMGNAVAVPVAEWVMTNIAKATQ